MLFLFYALQKNEFLLLRLPSQSRKPRTDNKHSQYIRNVNLKAIVCRYSTENPQIQP